MDNRQVLKRLADRLTETGIPVISRSRDGLFQLGLEGDGWHVWFLSCDRAGRIVSTNNSPDMIMRRLEGFARIRRSVEHAVESAAVLPCVTLSFTDRAAWVCQGGPIGRLDVSGERSILLHEGCWTITGDPLQRPYDRLYSCMTEASRSAVSTLIGRLEQTRCLLGVGDLSLDGTIEALRTLRNGIPESDY